jgi:hypothetical protein
LRDRYFQIINYVKMGQFNQDLQFYDRAYNCALTREKPGGLYSFSGLWVRQR